MIFFLAGVFGCGANNGKQYTEAAIGLATMVGTTAVYRQTTGGCWANCSRGYACDRKSGLCRRSECIPSCGASQTCVIEEDDRFRCVDMVGAVPLTPLTPTLSSSSAPPASTVAPTKGASPE